MLTAYVKNIPLFKHLKEPQLREIAARCKSVHYAKGERGLSKDRSEHRSVYRQLREA